MIKDPRNPNLQLEVVPGARAIPRGEHPHHLQEKTESIVEVMKGKIIAEDGTTVTTTEITETTETTEGTTGIMAGEVEMTDIADKLQHQSSNIIIYTLSRESITYVVEFLINKIIIFRELI